MSLEQCYVREHCLETLCKLGDLHFPGGICIDISAFRMRLLSQSLVHWVQYIVQLFLGVTRQSYLWQLAMLSIIHCTYRLGIPTIWYNVHTVMQSYQLLFLPYQKVCEYVS